LCQIIDGAAIAERIRIEIKQQTMVLKEKTSVVPKLTVILVGDDPSSHIYVRNKINACIEAGFDSEVIKLPEATKEVQIISIIHSLNSDHNVHGILVQLPLPRHINEGNIVASIDPNKDVDGIHPLNIGRLFLGKPSFIACTPLGCIKLLEEYKVKISAKNAVVVGRSNIVGKPMAALLLHKNATVTICHSRTKNLPEITREADILVTAIGNPGYVTADMVKEGAVVIDVGINRLSSGKLIGDVDFASVINKAAMITPVPKGVGPMTIAMLLSNTLKAVCDQNG